MRAIGIIAGIALVAAGVIFQQPGLIMAGIGMVISTVVGLLRRAPTPSPTAAQPDPGTQLTVRQAAAPHQIIFGRRRVSGIYAFIHSADTAPGNPESVANQWLHLVIVWAGHQVEAVDEIWFNDEVVAFDAGTGVSSGRYAGYAFCRHHLGGADQAADAELVAAAPSYWTSDHRLRGRAYSYITLKWNRDVFAGSLPNITAVIRGYNQIYDPRSLTTGYSANAALCAAAYLTAGFGLGAAYSEIDEDDLIESANVCDEDVARRAGGVENRYELHGAFPSSRPRGGVLQDMLTAMRGEAVFAGGKWRILAGAWRSAVLDLGDGDLRGGFQTQTLLSRRDNFNGVKGTFASEADNWQPVDFPPVSSATYLAQDGGERVWKDVKFDFTVSSSAAQRLAKIDLLAARQPITISKAPFMLKALAARAGDNVTFSHERFGWTTKTFHVNDLTLALGEMTERGPPLVGVDLGLRETAAADFDWSTSEEGAYDPAPNTNLPSIFTVLPPSALTVTERKEATRDASGVKVFADLSWVAAPDAFVQSGGAYQIEYRAVGATDWIVQPRIAATAYTIEDIPPGNWQFRVRSVNAAGVLSSEAGSPTVTKELLGLLDLPAAPNGLTLQAIGGQAYLSWQPTSDLDVRIGGWWVFKHAASGTDWAAAVSIGDEQPGGVNSTFLPLRAGTYLVKTRDSAGQYSAMAASVAASQISLLAFTAAHATITESPGFAGVKSGTFAESGALSLDSAGDFDDVPEVDALPSWDFYDGVTGSGTYSFATVADLGSVKTVRVTPTIAALIYDIYESFDAREGPVDDWLSWDGAVTGNEADAVLWSATTQIDPAIAIEADWSAWQRCDGTELRGRGLRFQLRLASTDEAFNIRITTLSVAIEERA